MERRSRSQVRRLDNGLSTVSTSRHASTTRADQPPPVANQNMDPSRTLSPDRKDRYRSSGRGGGGNSGYNGYAPGMNGSYNGPSNGVSYPPPDLMVPPQGSIHVQPPGPGQPPHSNSNSYNQYTHNPPPLINNNPSTLPPPQQSAGVVNGNGYGEYRSNGLPNGGPNMPLSSPLKGMNHQENSNTLTSQVSFRNNRKYPKLH